ncbi:MAG: hypothetical protein QXY98_03880, partial [Thermoplasmata archaeon]
MSGKILLILSRCSACSWLDKNSFKDLVSQIRLDKRIGKIIETDKICDSKGKKKLKSSASGGCDRAIIASWCSQESLGKIPLPKGIDPSLVEFVDLSLLSPKGPKERSSPELLAGAVRESAARLALSRPVKDRRIRYSSKFVAVIGSSDAAIRAARALAQHGIPTRLIISQKASKPKDGNIELIDEATINGLTGIPGNFRLSYRRRGEELETDCAAILLVGERCMADVRPPTNPRVRFVPLERLEDFATSGLRVKGIAFLDDLGSLASVSDVSVPLWHLLLESAKSTAVAGYAENVTVIARDVKAAGLLELSWKEAAEAGVKFVRYDDKTRPRIDKSEPIILVKD